MYEDLIQSSYLCKLRAKSCEHASFNMAWLALRIESILLEAQVSLLGLTAVAVTLMKAREKMVYISVMGELCGPASSATHRQTGGGLHQHGWSNDACAIPQ